MLRTFTKDPAAFGLLNAQPTLVDAQMIYGQLIASVAKDRPLSSAQKSLKQRPNGNSEVAKFAAEHPALYWELQEEKSSRVNR